MVLRAVVITFRQLLLIATWICCVSLAQARILIDEEASSADIQSLALESALFETLQKSIALSLAQCEFDAVCTPNVRKQGLQGIVDALGQRVSRLGVRYEETGEAALEPILISYVGSLDAYTAFIEKLSTIAPELDAQRGDIEDVFANQFGRLPNISQLYSIFEDIDEEILDDENLEEFELEEFEEVPPTAETLPATEKQIQ